MPKRKKLPSGSDYVGVGIDTDLYEIQKTRPLKSLSETDLTLAELKILDAYLARINSHDAKRRTVKLSKGELERYLGVSRILKDDLTKRLKHLFQVVEVKDTHKRKGFKLISLFEEADAEQDENGLWQITLTCTQSAREYVFNIDNIGYLRYRLKNVVNLTSRYSYVLFLYLVDNRWRKSWNVDLSEVKKILNCTAETYTQYYRFNDLILKKCQKEICEKTDLQFTYTSIKRGRKVTAICFTVATMSDILATADELPTGTENESQMVLDGYGGTGTYTYSNDNFALLAECGVNFAFDDTQINIIWDTLAPLSDGFFGEMSVSKSRIDYYISYVSRLYNKLVLAEKSKQAQKLPPIKNRFEYFLQMMDNDIKKRLSADTIAPPPDSSGGKDTTAADEYAGLSMFTD